MKSILNKRFAELKDQQHTKHQQQTQQMSPSSSHSNTPSVAKKTQAMSPTPQKSLFAGKQAQNSPTKSQQQHQPTQPTQPTQPATPLHKPQTAFKPQSPQQGPQPGLFKSGSNGNLLSSASNVTQPFYNASSGGTVKSNLPVYLNYLNHAKSVANLANGPGMHLGSGGHHIGHHYNHLSGSSDMLSSVSKSAPVKTLNMHKSNENLFDACATNKHQNNPYLQSQQRSTPPKTNVGVNNGTYTKATTNHLNYQMFDAHLEKVSSSNVSTTSSKKHLIQGYFTLT